MLLGYFHPINKDANIFENPSNAKATFVQSTRTQIFEKPLNPVMLVFSGVLSDEYPCDRVSVIFQVICIILYWPN